MAPHVSTHPALCPPACLPACSLTRVGVMVLVCHESNDIFLEAAKVWGGAWGVVEMLGREHCRWLTGTAEVPGSLARLATPMRWLSTTGTGLPILQMARYAKHETATTAIFVGEWVNCWPSVAKGRDPPQGRVWHSAPVPFLLLAPHHCCVSCRAHPRLAVFMLSWFTTRVFAFPAWVIRSTLFESLVRAAPALHGNLHEPVSVIAPNWQQLMLFDLLLFPQFFASMLCRFTACPLQERASALGVQVQPHHAILNSFLIFLYCLHVYWCVAEPAGLLVLGCQCMASWTGASLQFSMQREGRA